MQTKKVAVVIKSFFSLQSLRYILALVLCYTTGLQGQSYIADVRKLSVEDGLSNRFVNTIYKDSRGFMWIGTRYGLNRYDGYEFKHYTAENSTLTTNDIERVHEDAHQRLWLLQKVKKERTIDIMDLHTGRIQNFDTVFKNHAPFKAASVIRVCSDSKKNFWITTTSGKIYRYKNRQFEHIFSSDHPISINILYAGKDFLWFFYEDLLGIRFKTITGVDLKTGITKEVDVRERLLSIGMDDNQTLWLFHPVKKNFLQVHWEKQVLEPAGALPPELPDLSTPVTFSKKQYLDTSGNFLWWLPNAGFPAVYHLGENISYDFQDEMAPLLTYEGLDHIANAYLDTENQLWLATQDGVFSIGLTKNKFTTVIAANGENYSARDIAEDNNGVIYVVTYGGYLRIDPQKEYLVTEGPELGKGVIKDREGKLWFGLAGVKIGVYDPVNGKSRRYMYQRGSDKFIRPPQVLMHDAKGRVWVASNEGIYMLEPDTGHFQKFARYNAFTALKNSDIYQLQETEDGIWITASSGLYLLEPGKGIIARYSVESAPPYQIPYNHILHFYRDSEGIFWLAT